jgi:hypothetical protein
VGRAHQLAAALDVLAGHEVAEGDDAAADAVAGLEHQDVVARRLQLEGGGQAREAGPDDDDPLARLVLAEGMRAAHEQAGRRGQRGLQHLAAGQTVGRRLAELALELPVEKRHLRRTPIRS